MTSGPKASRTALVVLLRAKRSGMSASEKAKRKKPAKWLYPWATEHRYVQSYRAWVKPVREFVHQFLAKHQEAILNGDSKDAVIRTDAVAGESFALMVQSLNGWVNAYISDDEDKKLQSPIYMGLGDIADSAFDFNGRQYDKSMKSAIGISFPDDESWWPEAREMWQDSNYETIRSDIKKYIADINTATEQAVTNGWSVKALADKIIALDTKITKSRANFIARDQIGKLNGTITQKRMQDAGLSMYVWDTSGDERVRESHAVMEGLLCRWDDATVCSYDGGRTWVPRPAGAVLMHPGMDYQCRCCADAYFNELLDEADGVEPGEGYVETSAATITESTGETGIPSSSISIDFIPAKNIKEANDYAMNILGIPHADYRGVSLEAANEWNKGLAENFKRFPELKERFGFVGECHARNTAAKNKYKELFYLQNRTLYEDAVKKQFPWASIEKQKEIVENSLELYFKKGWNDFSKKCRLSVPKNLVGASWSPGGWAKEFAGITVNKDKVKDYEKFLMQANKMVEIKWSPVGAGTLKATLDHEIGHQIDSLLDIKKDSVIVDLWNSLSHNQITEGLSQYAWDNTSKEPICEFIAEAWSEYCNNPEPRQIAKTVGDRIMEIYKAWKKK